MSDQSGNNGDEEPSRKRLKRGDDEAAPPEISAFGGPMYDEATARKMLMEVVLVSAESSFQEDDDEVIGFDPNDEALDNIYFVDNGDFGEWCEYATPMTYFARKGDAKMCRYLISRGASTTKASDRERSFFPVYSAAFEGHLNICKLFYANGARSDVRRDYGEGWTPFHIAAHKGHDEVVRWLVLHGAICADGDSEEIQGDFIIYPEVFRFADTHLSWLREGREKISRSCQRLVEWSKEVTQTHSAVVMFLLGTLPPAPGKDQSRTLQCLSGHPGVRKHIGNFVGLEVTKRKQLRILRSVVDVLPSFIHAVDLRADNA